MCVDLLKLIVFADRTGKLQKTQQRRLFTVIDGVIGGENKGPLEPDPVKSGILLASENLLAADIVATRLMGFDPMKIKMLESAMKDEKWDFGVDDFDDIEVVSLEHSYANCLHDKTSRFCDFRPYPGWVGHIEI
jgi:uncharacterized protein (DUF362 family)